MLGIFAPRGDSNESKLRQIDLRHIHVAATRSHCGSSALNFCHRVAARRLTSSLDSNAPRFCFKPRSSASCSEIGRTPGTNFPGTLPEKLLCVCGAAGDCNCPFDVPPDEER